MLQTSEDEEEEDSHSEEEEELLLDWQGLQLVEVVQWLELELDSHGELELVQWLLLELEQELGASQGLGQCLLGRKLRL